MHAIILHCGTKLARIAPPKKLTDSYTHFDESLTQSHIKYLDTQIHTINYYITEVYLVLRHWWVVHGMVLLYRSAHCFITLLSYTQRFSIA